MTVWKLDVPAKTILDHDNGTANYLKQMDAEDQSRAGSTAQFRDDEERRPLIRGNMSNK
jgi:hypothetical protein